MSDEGNGFFCWVDLSSHDMEASVTWYSGLFGWELGRVDQSGAGPYGMFSLAGTDVAGIGEMNAEMKAMMPPVWNSYVQVEDCAATVARAKELGAEVVFDTQDAGGQGMLAYLKDPDGAVFALWQPLQPRAKASGEEPGRFCWQELATGDLERAAAFYSELFGWTLTPMEGSPTAVRIAAKGDKQFAHLLQMDEEWEGIPPHWGVYFCVADTDATCAKAKETGGAVHVPPTDIPPGRFSVIADPQGATFHVLKPSG